MSAEGNLKLNDTLLQLHEKRRGGVVRAECGKVKKQIVLREGHVAFAESNQPEEHLVRMMTKAGLLPRPAIAAITDQMKSGKSADEAILAGSDVGAVDVQQAAREQAVEILASLMGSDTFAVRYFGCEDRIVRSLDLEIPVPELLATAARRAACNRRAAEQLRGTVTPADGGRLLHSGIALEPREAYGCSLAERPIAVEEFLQLMPEGDPSPQEILLRLVLLGFLSVQTEIQPAEAAAPRQDDADLATQLDELERQFEVSNHYEILSVSTDASDEDIKTAYHRLAKQYHPDLFQSDRYSLALRSTVERVFTCITAAYSTLGNPAARAVYDEQRLTRESQVEAALQARAGVDLDKDKTARALFRLGREAILAKDYEKAVTTLSECVFLRPEVARYRHLLGVAQAETPKYRKESEQNLLKAIELDPMSIDSRLALGSLYVKVELPRRAEAQYEQVLRWDPGNKEALRRLAELK